MEDRDIKPAERTDRERACRGLRFGAVTCRHEASPLLSLGFVVHSNGSGVHGYKAVDNRDIPCRDNVLDLKDFHGI